MEKITKIIDFIWILFYFLKITLSKIFFIPKKNPDLYIADNQGFFHNQSDIRYVPIKVLWDVLRVAKIIYNFNKRTFVSLYIRGGVPLGNFTEKISDLDFILVSLNPNSCMASINYIQQNINTVCKKVQKIDISVVGAKDFCQNAYPQKTKLQLNFESVFLFGEKINIEAKILKSDATLWSFFTSFLNKKENKLSIINELETLHAKSPEERKAIARKVLKNIIRGKFENICKNGEVYTKNLFLISSIFKNRVNYLSGTDKLKVESCLKLLEMFDLDFKNEEEVDNFKKITKKALDLF